MKNIKTLSELEDKYIGEKGTPERTAYEKELADLMIGYQVKNARIKLDLTQEELAERIHKKRSFISRVENDGSNLTLKVIMEVVLLTDEEIATAARIIRDAGASFAKTGTGWAGATTEHHIEVIKAAVGDTIPLKVAGGVRSLDTLLKMRDMGVSRFGIGYKSALHIMQEAEERGWV